MAKQGSDASSVELSHYVTVVRRRWRYVAAGVAAGIVVAASLVLFLPATATAATLVNVNLISSNAFNSQRPASDLIDMQTEQAAARSTSVMSAVAEGLGSGWTDASVRAATSATLLPDGTVLRIEFTAPQASDAALGSTLVAEEYLAYRSELAQDRVDVAAQRLVERRNALNRQLARANARVSQAPQGAERISEEMARQGIADELSAVTTQLNEIRAVDTSGGTIFTEADAKQVQVSPNRPLILGSGLFGGALLGLVLAFVANVLDRRVRDSYDVYGAGGGISVARLGEPSPRLPAEGEDAESLRAVRERLLSAVPSHRPVISVIDVGEAGGMPSDVAANLAVALADSGMSTDLVLAGHPNQVLQEILTSLQAVEVDGVGAARRFRSGAGSALTVLVPEQGHQRLSTADIVSDLLADAVRDAEATVVGVAQTAGPAVRLSAGRASHQVLLVVEEMTTRIDDLAQVATDLVAVQATIHGTVLVPRGRHFDPAAPSAPATLARAAPRAPSVPARPVSDTAALLDAPVGHALDPDEMPEGVEVPGSGTLPQRTPGDASGWPHLRQSLERVIDDAPAAAPEMGLEVDDLEADELGAADGAAAVAADVDDPVEESVAEEPEFVEEPVVEEPEPVDEAVAEEAEPVEEPVTDEDEPVAEEPEPVEESVTDEDVPVAEEAEPVEQPVEEEPVVEATVADEPEAVDEAVAEEAEPVEEPVAEETVTDEPEPVEEPVADEAGPVEAETAEPETPEPETAEPETREPAAQNGQSTVARRFPFDVVDVETPIDVPVVANENSWAFNR
ncbi:hypothetical protein [Nocardioides malaquae]|uniref:hypothetical protein n=1 Tax=Nocardioides malaquae TaxID=2773426 RepID=UPI001D0D0A50|nr:hypothetical protein [Nocardioides malaquae]